MKNLLKKVLVTAFAACVLAFSGFAGTLQDYVPEDAVLAIHMNSNDLFTCPTTTIMMMSMVPVLNGTGYDVNDLKFEAVLFAHDLGNEQFDVVSRIEFASNTAEKVFREIRENNSNFKESKVGVMPALTLVEKDPIAKDKDMAVEVILINKKCLQFHYSMVSNTTFGKVFQPVGKPQKFSAYFAEQKLCPDSTIMVYANFNKLKSKSFVDNLTARGDLKARKEIELLNNTEISVVQLKLQRDGGLLAEIDSKMKPGTDMKFAKEKMDELKVEIEALREKYGAQGANFGSFESGVNGEHVFARIHLTAEGFAALIQSGMTVATELATPHGNNDMNPKE